MTQFLLQMAGEAGTGKSSLARAIGQANGAVVLDKDYFKAPLLEEGLSEELAAGLAYAVFFSLAGSLLRQGHSLILDSPAFYPSIPARGALLAEEVGATYRLIECRCPAESQEQRLNQRQGLASQPASRAAKVASMLKPEITPLIEPHLTIDTSKPLDVCLEQALRYLERGEG